MAYIGKWHLVASITILRCIIGLIFFSKECFIGETLQLIARSVALRRGVGQNLGWDGDVQMVSLVLPRDLRFSKLGR